MYVYDNDVLDIAKRVKPSSRSELETTIINNAYLEKCDLSVELLGRGIAWLDEGDFEILVEASQFVHIIDKRQGYKIACLKEIAWRNGWLSAERLLEQASALGKSSYGSYLTSLVDGEFPK